MVFICSIGNCKRLKYPVVFTTWEELHAHINSDKWQHGPVRLTHARLDYWNKTRFELSADARLRAVSSASNKPTQH